MKKPLKSVGGIIISPSCHLFCWFCKGRSKRSPQEIREQEIKVYKNLIDLKNRGIKHIIISGADPIEYEYIVELAKYIKQQGFQNINLSTHGTRLSNLSFAKKLSFSGINSLRIPIYGSKAKVHDSITRTKGSFKEVIKGIKNIKKINPKINIEISCLIMKQNKDDILNVVKFVKNDLKIKNFYLSVPCIVENYESFYIPFKELKIYLEKIYKEALKINPNILFKEIPFCLFGQANFKNINNNVLPPDLGRYNQPPEQFKTAILDLPSYRLKKKIKICSKCRVASKCDGFFVNDLEKYGLEGIEPIK
jgi:MoaA/NifB/PqqE/SkfB family radical SAM enzyme